MGALYTRFRHSHPTSLFIPAQFIHSHFLLAGIPLRTVQIMHSEEACQLLCPEDKTRRAAGVFEDPILRVDEVRQSVWSEVNLGAEGAISAAPVSRPLAMTGLPGSVPARDSYIDVKTAPVRFR